MECRSEHGLGYWHRVGQWLLFSVHFQTTYGPGPFWLDMLVSRCEQLVSNSPFLTILVTGMKLCTDPLSSVSLGCRGCSKARIYPLLACGPTWWLAFCDIDHWAVVKRVGSFALSSLLHSCRAVLPSTPGICILTSRSPNFYAKVLPPLVKNPSHICGSDKQRFMLCARMSLPALKGTQRKAKGWATYHTPSPRAESGPECSVVDLVGS